jgi:hypothetical protein
MANFSSDFPMIDFSNFWLNPRRRGVQVCETLVGLYVLHRTTSLRTALSSVLTLFLFSNLLHAGGAAQGQDGRDIDLPQSVPGSFAVRGDSRINDLPGREVDPRPPKPKYTPPESIFISELLLDQDPALFESIYKSKFGISPKVCVFDARSDAPLKVHVDYDSGQVAAPFSRYTIVFAARGGTTGHAFVVFGEHDPEGGKSTSVGYGLYPTDESISAGVSKIPGMNLVFGDVPAEIRDEAGPDHSSSHITTQVIVPVNEAQWAAAKKILSATENAPGPFVATQNDCVKFMASVAEAVGLNLPERSIMDGTVLPEAYVKALSDSINNGVTTSPGATGGVYKGQVLDGSPHGRGKYKGPGEDFDGMFTDGGYSRGKLHTPDADFEGQHFKRGKLQGPGVSDYIGADGGKYHYEGKFKDGKFDGHGTIYAGDHDIKFDGTFKKGEIIEGEMRVPNPGGAPTVFSGRFENGQLDGPIQVGPAYGPFTAELFDHGKLVTPLPPPSNPTPAPNPPANPPSPRNPHESGRGPTERPTLQPVEHGSSTASGSTHGPVEGPTGGSGPSHGPVEGPTGGMGGVLPKTN